MSDPLRCVCVGEDCPVGSWDVACGVCRLLRSVRDGFIEESFSGQVWLGCQPRSRSVSPLVILMVLRMVGILHGSHLRRENEMAQFLD